MSSRAGSSSPGRAQPHLSSGYSFAELLVVTAIVAILAAIGAVAYSSYARTTAVQWTAQEIQSGLNRAKMLAVATRQNVCIEVTAGAFRFHQPDCSGGSTVWTGSGTDSSGWMRPANSTVTVSNAGAAPIFTPFGTAAQTATLTVSGAQGNPTTVSVSAAGRVTIP